MVKNFSRWVLGIGLVCSWGIPGAMASRLQVLGQQFIRPMSRLPAYGSFLSPKQAAFHTRSWEENGQVVHFCEDPKVGLKSWIVIDSTKNGPALGGTRFFPYPDDAAALEDGKRLAHRMTLKSYFAGLPLGGGKAVIMDSGIFPQGRQALLKSFGRFVHSLNGQYLAAIDSGTNVEDMKTIASQTSHVVCTDHNPAPYTAEGVFVGIQAALPFVFSESTIENKRVLIQGGGAVGSVLARFLHQKGTEIFIWDVNPERAGQVAWPLGGKAFPFLRALEGYKVDVFAPCALGGVNAEMVSALKGMGVKLVAGAANNQLKTLNAGDRLHKEGIMYVPGFLINAGGLIKAWGDKDGWSPPKIASEIQAIGPRIADVLKKSQAQGRSPTEILDKAFEGVQTPLSPDILSMKEMGRATSPSQ